MENIYPEDECQSIYDDEHGETRPVVIVKKGTTGEDAAPRINAILQAVKPHTLVSFEAGKYNLCSPLQLQGKHDLALDGNGSVLIPYYNRESYGDQCSDAIHVTECSRILIRDFTVCASQPVNTAATVLNTTEDYVDLKIDSAFSCTGKEKYITGYSFHETGVPSYIDFLSTKSDPSQRDMVAHEIPCTSPKVLDTPHEKIAEHTVRTYSLSHRELKPGMRCCIRHSYYGPAAFLFKHSEQVICEDIKVTNFGGMVFVILPRCRNFTLRRIQIAPVDPERQYFSSNADGVHITGLMGKLTVEDCYFRSLGDDVINAHTLAMRAASVDGEWLNLYFDKVNGQVPERWAMTGDVLRVYDPITLARKADLTVGETNGARLRVLSVHDAAAGDIIVNSAYFPKISILRCVSHTMRDRAYVIQAASKLLVKDCTFYNTTGAALYLSTAFQKFYEVGPVENVEITNNLIVGCNEWSKASYAAIHIWVRGEYPAPLYNIHHHIHIHHNRFEHITGRAVYAASIDGLTITANVLHACGNKRDMIEVVNCHQASVEHNTATGDGKTFGIEPFVKNEQPNSNIPY